MGAHLFDDLPKKQIDRLYKAGHFRRMVRGDVLFRKGATGDEFFILLTGRVGVFDEIDGARKMLAELGPGDCFGEMAVFAGGRRSATIVCTEAGQLLVIDEAKLMKLAEKDLHPVFLEKVLVVMADRLRHINALYMRAKYGEQFDGGTEDDAAADAASPRSA